MNGSASSSTARPGLLGLVGRYQLVAVTILVGIVGLLLLLFGAPSPVITWLVSGYALLVALQQTVGMVRDLFRGRFGIDILAVSAIIATVVVGEFWAALVVVLMLTGGEALEDYAGNRSQRELNALLRRVPQVAHLQAPDGSLREVPASEIEVGDLILVRPGEVVPVDGRLESESGSFDESQLTGESLPVDRVRGEVVLSGAVNGTSAVTEVGS